MPTSLSGIPLIDPERLKRDCDRRGFPTDQWWGTANQFVVPLWHRDGVPYGRGQVLIHPGHYARLPADKTALTLTFTDAAGTAIAFSPVCQIGIERVVYGADDDSASVYLLTLADRRYRFRQVSVGRAYNVRDDANNWVTSSLNAGVAWTWAGLVSDLWGLLTTAFPDFTAAAPTFPTSPAGTPEGFYFEGADAWAALVRVVEAAGFLLRFDPTADAADIVAPAADERAMADAEKRVRLRDTQQHADAEPPWPESLLVTFPRRGRTSRYTVSVSVGEGGAAGTTEVVWDDLPAVGGSVLNTAALANRAAAVLAIWKWDFRTRFGSADREFAGCLDYVRLALGTGSWTAWAMSDRGHRDRNGGLISAMAAGGGLAQRRDRMDLDVGDLSSIILATQNLDGTEVGTTADMRFEQATGVEIRQSPGAVAWDQVRLRAATPTQWGAVTTNEQTVGGKKTSATGEDASRGGWYTTATVGEKDVTAGYVPFQADYTNAATAGANDGMSVRLWPLAAGAFTAADQYTDTSPVTLSASVAQTVTSVAAWHGVERSGFAIPPATSLSFLRTPPVAPNSYEHTVACGSPDGLSAHTWGVYQGTSLRRGITSVTTGPMIVPHEWCGGLVVTQKELTALVPSSPPPPYTPPGYVVSPPPPAVSPPPPPTSPPLPQGYSTPGKALAVDAVAASTLTGNRLVLVSPNGTQFAVTIDNFGGLTTTSI